MCHKKCQFHLAFLQHNIFQNWVHQVQIVSKLGTWDPHFVNTEYRQKNVFQKWAQFKIIFEFWNHFDAKLL